MDAEIELLKRIPGLDVDETLRVANSIIEVDGEEIKETMRLGMSAETAINQSADGWLFRLDGEHTRFLVIQYITKRLF